MTKYQLLVVASVCSVFVLPVRAGLVEEAAFGETESIQNSLNKDPDLVKKYNEEKKSVLVPACDGGHREIVKLFLEHGADVNIPSQSRKTYPIQAAVQGNDPEIVKMIAAAGAKWDVVDKNKWTLFHYGAFHNSSEGLKVALEAFKKSGDSWAINIDTPNDQSVRPLDLALLNKKKQASLVLLNNGADYRFDAKEDRYSVMYLAARADFPEVVKWLLDHGVDVEQLDESDDTPLFTAVRWNALKAAKVLLEHGAVVDDGIMWKVQQRDKNDMIDLLDQYPDQHKLEEEW